MIQVTDSRGQMLSFESPPKRVVSLIPSITESLFEMGLGSQIAGISKYCIYPLGEVESKIKVGGQKNPDFQKITDINPDLILLNEEENKPEHIDYFLKNYKTFVTYPRKYKETESLLTDLGKIFDVPVVSYLKQLKQFPFELNKKKMFRTLYLIWRNPWMSINEDTFIHDVLKSFNMINVFGNRKERYFEVTARDIEITNPEIIILPNEPYNFLEKHIAEFHSLQIDAVKSSRLFLVDGTFFCWYGTRMVKTYDYITNTILNKL